MNSYIVTITTDVVFCIEAEDTETAGDLAYDELRSMGHTSIALSHFNPINSEVELDEED